MSTPKDRYKILQNIIAKAGGIEKVDLHSELAKSEAILNQHKAMGDMADYNNALQSTNPALTGQATPVESQNNPDQTAEMPIPDTNSSQVGESIGRYDNL